MSNRKDTVTYTADDAHRLHGACCDNAERMLNAAGRLLQADPIPNLAYHFATLALEELGKAGFIVAMAMRGDADENDWAANRLDDHESKLMWALWTPLLGRKPITRQQVEEVRELARSIHDRRMAATYVSPESSAPTAMLPHNVVSVQDAQQLVDAARARLAIERGVDTSRLGETNQDMTWMLAAIADHEKRRQIYSKGSLDKLAELSGDVRQWIAWLRKSFEGAQVAAQELVRRELAREQPQGDAALRPKWFTRVRLHSSTHSIRPRVLANWNRMSGWLKLVAVDNRKNELFLDITLRANVSAGGLWYTSWGAARQFVTALNIGSMGYFWWYLPQQTTRFYERIRDLDAPGEFELAVDLVPKLKVDWGSRLLNEVDLNRTGMVFGMMARMEHAEQDRVFGPYAGGLVFISKTDVHFRFAADACACFAQSLFLGLQHFGDWDGDEASLDAALQTTLIMPTGNPDFAELVSLAKHSAKLAPEDRSGLTIDDALKVKLLCDYYFCKVASRMLEAKTSAVNSKPSIETS